MNIFCRTGCPSGLDKGDFFDLQEMVSFISGHQEKKESRHTISQLYSDQNVPLHPPNW